MKKEGERNQTEREEVRRRDGDVGRNLDFTYTFGNLSLVTVTEHTSAEYDPRNSCERPRRRR
jgi:hypothetical protein